MYVIKNYKSSQYFNYYIFTKLLIFVKFLMPDNRHTKTTALIRAKRSVGMEQRQEIKIEASISLNELLKQVERDNNILTLFDRYPIQEFRAACLKRLEIWNKKLLRK